MRKIILLSFLTFFSFSFESVGMEEDPAIIEKKSVSSKRKLDSRRQHIQDNKGPASSNLVTKKPKLERGKNLSLVDDSMKYPYVCKSNRLAKKPGDQLFKSPFHPVIAHYAKTGDFGKYACQSASNMCTSDSRENTPNIHPLSNTRKSPFYISMPHSHKKRISGKEGAGKPKENSETAIRIFDYCDQMDNKNNDLYQENQNNNLSPKKTLLYTKKDTFYFSTKREFQDFLK